MESPQLLYKLKISGGNKTTSSNYLREMQNAFSETSKN